MTQPLTQLGHAVLLQGVAVADAAVLVARGIRSLSARDGVAPLPRWVALERGLRAAAGGSSDTGSGEVPEALDPTSLPAEDLIPTSEVATLLGISPRQVRNIATTLGGIRLGRAWVFDRGRIEAEVIRRREEEGHD